MNYDIILQEARLFHLIAIARFQNFGLYHTRKGMEGQEKQALVLTT